ncbi:hypothetical protein B0H11DRAFT_1744833, partial [Mycena galericulata]
LRIQGSALAPRGTRNKMLEFTAFHKNKPVIERFPMTKSGVEEGMEKLRSEVQRCARRLDGEKRLVLVFVRSRTG